MVVALGVCLGFAVPGVLAHAELVAAEPEAGAQLVEPPAEIRLTFSEPVAVQSDIVVLGEGFAPVAGLLPQLDGARPEQVYTPLPPLEPGTYTVQWSAVSADGHEISGSYAFSIGAGGGLNAALGRELTGARVMGWLLTLAAVALVTSFFISWYRRANR